MVRAWMEVGMYKWVGRLLVEGWVDYEQMSGWESGVCVCVGVDGI